MFKWSCLCVVRPYTAFKHLEFHFSDFTYCRCRSPMSAFLRVVPSVPPAVLLIFAWSWTLFPVCFPPGFLPVPDLRSSQNSRLSFLHAKWLCSSCSHHNVNKLQIWVPLTLCYNSAGKILKGGGRKEDGSQAVILWWRMMPTPVWQGASSKQLPQRQTATPQVSEGAAS